MRGRSLVGTHTVAISELPLFASDMRTCITLHALHYIHYSVFNDLHFEDKQLQIIVTTHGWK